MSVPVEPVASVGPVVRAGAGPRALLVHGSAADHTTWSITLASSALRARLALMAYTRRGDRTTVEAFADDAATLLAAEPGPALIIGSSFGSVIALDVVRRYPTLCAGAVLIEPPMPASDVVDPTARTLLGELDRRALEHGAPAAAEGFLRTVLGEAAFERMPAAFRDRAVAKWPQIRADYVALLDYRPRYAALRAVTTPILLVGGERSAPYFRPTLEALLATLPAARLEYVNAGHMLHAEGHRRFGELVLGFATSIALG